MKRFTLVSLTAVTGLMAGAEVLDRPAGFKIGERMTLQPSVAISATYDSNVDPYYNSGDNSRNRKKDDFFWTVSPALRLLYEAESWSLNLSAYYNFRQYFNNCHQNLNQHNFGEDLRWNWSNSVGSEKGWTILLGQGFRQITMADDMVEGAGNYSGDSRQLHFEGAIQRRFNEYWHADLNASYYWLDYQNDTKNNYAFYGWDRATVGAEAGFAPSRWTDFIVNAFYQYFDQDNVKGTSYSSSSDGFAVQAVPAYNITPGREMFHPQGRDNGYVFDFEGFRIYVAGDTEDIPEMADIVSPDVAFLPCNQPYTMTPEQLVKATKALQPKVLFPYHYGQTDVSVIAPMLERSGVDVRIRQYQ